MTVLTHWHWDHTFGMHAVRGLCLANERTNDSLRAIRDRIQRDGLAAFFALHESIRWEYAGGRPVIVSLADMTFPDAMALDAGNCPVHVFRAEAPHTDDSTFIYASGERALFLGDAMGGVFPTGEKDRTLCRKLAETISALDADICLEGHWTPTTKAEAMDELLS